MEPTAAGEALLSLLEGIAGPIGTIFKTLSILLGGIFGIYLIFAILTYVLKRKDMVVLRQIKAELTRLNHTVDHIEKKLSNRPSHTQHTQNTKAAKRR